MRRKGNEVALSFDYHWIYPKMNTFDKDDEVKEMWMKNGSLLIKVLYNVIYQSLVSKGQVYSV